MIEAYGMTENAHQMASNPLPPDKRKAGFVGCAAGPKVAIMSPAGKILKAGKEGEVVTRGPNVTKGYENNPEANETAFAHGWFHTGDQGYMDEDGYPRSPGASRKSSTGAVKRYRLLKSMRRSLITRPFSRPWPLRSPRQAW